MTPYEFLTTNRPHTLHVQHLNGTILALLFRHRARRVVMAIGQGETVDDALHAIITDYRYDMISDALVRIMSDANIVQVALSITPDDKCRATVTYAVPRIALTKYTYATGALPIRRLLDSMLSDKRGAQ